MQPYEFSSEFFSLHLVSHTWIGIVSFMIVKRCMTYFHTDFGHSNSSLFMLFVCVCVYFDASRTWKTKNRTQLKLEFYCALNLFVYKENYCLV